MKLKWIECFSALLLLTGSITPSVHAVTQIDAQESQTQSTQTENLKSETVSSSESTNSSETEISNTDSSPIAEIQEPIAINEDNFPDQHFRQWLLVNIDKDQDGILSHELLETTDLIINEQKIESLEGIKFFKKLKKLGVQKNELKELDVRSLEDLVYLDVSYNHLTELDLSKNEQLAFFAGAHQTVKTKAIFSQGTWQIQDQKLQPDPEKIIITSPEWQYKNAVFTSEEQVPLSYECALDFSEKVSLEENSEKNLVIQADIQYEQTTPETVTKAESIIPHEKSITLATGETKELGYKTVPEASEVQEPVWESEDPAIVSVDDSGVVTAISSGKAKITLKDGKNKLGFFEINVVEAEKTVPSETEETAEKADNSKKQENYTARATAKPTVSYQTHVKNIGWQSAEVNGATAGTTGRNLWMEAIKLNVAGAGVSGNIEYSSHIKNIGWQNYVSNGAISGTTGKVLQMEAIKIRLTGQLKENYDVYYRVHTANFGWLGWAKNGENAGTAGYVYQMEAIQVQIIAKNQSGPATGNAFFEKNKNNPTISYETHVKNIGWQSAQKNGATAGTTGQNLQVEAFKMNLSSTTLTGAIEYSAHVKNIGWQNFVKNGAIAGTTGQVKQVEAIRIRLTGQINQFYNVFYRVHAANFGWLGWAKNGADAGSAGFVYHVEAIQVKLVPKGQPAPGGGIAFYDKSTLKDPNVNYQAHVRNIGWQSVQANGATSGTTGQSGRIEGMKINVADTPIPGAIEYIGHVQNIGWQSYVRNNALAGTTGRALNMEAVRIRLTGQLNHFYDVYYRIHSTEFGWLGWAKNDQYAGTSGLNLPMEAIQIVLVRKGGSAPGTTDQPYRTSINHLFVMGHGVNDPGASYNGVNERDFTRNELLPYLRKWAGRLSKKNKITFYDTNSDMYQDSQRLQGAYVISSTFSSVTEFHLDAGGIGISTGGHVIVHKDSNYRTAQNFAIANTIRNYVGWWGSVAQTNGLSARTDLLNMNVLHSRNIPYRLAELGFITNTKDVANIRKNIDQIAKRMVESVTEESL